MLKVTKLSHRFGAIRALDELTLQIPEGAIFGLLGPNGAGKTTLLRVIQGLVTPTSGTVQLFDDLAPGSKQARARIGYMPQKLALYPGLSARENILFYGRIHGLKGADLQQRTQEMLRMVDLVDRADTPTAHLSGGMARRAMLATAVVHRPRLLILDEPTAGVDPVLRIRFWDWLEQLVGAGTSIIVTTHHISEAARCGRVVFLRAGRLLDEGSPTDLITRYQASDLEQAFVRATRPEIPDPDRAAP